MEHCPTPVCQAPEHSLCQGLDQTGQAPLEGIEVSRLGAGIVVNPQDSSQLASAVVEILTNDQKRSTMGKAAYKLVTEKYTWARHADIIEAEYRKI